MKGKRPRLSFNERITRYHDRFRHTLDPKCGRVALSGPVSRSKLRDEIVKAVQRDRRPRGPTHDHGIVTFKGKRYLWLIETLDSDMDRFCLPYSLVLRITHDERGGY